MIFARAWKRRTTDELAETELRDNGAHNERYHSRITRRRRNTVKSLLIKDTTREEREEIVRRALWGGCGSECEFCSGCDNMGGGRIDSLYQPYIDGEKEIADINAEYRAPFVR